MSEPAIKVTGIGGAVQKASSLLSSIPDGTAKAVMRALNRAATQGRTAAVKAIREDYAVKAGPVRRSFRIKKANLSSLEATIEGRGGNLPLANYRLSPRGDTTGAARKQVRVAVKNTGMKRLGASFIHKGRVLQRLGTRSLPVREVYGPAVPIIAGSGGVVDAVRDKMRQSFIDRLDHEANFLLSGGKTK